MAATLGRADAAARVLTAGDAFGIDAAAGIDAAEVEAVDLIAANDAGEGPLATATVAGRIIVPRKTASKDCIYQACEYYYY